MRDYLVTFTTQKARREITWGLWVSANNQTEAKDSAQGLWYNQENKHLATKKWDSFLGAYHYEHPHMFHVQAKHTQGRDKDLNVFFILDTRAVTWGYRR